MKLFLAQQNYLIGDITNNTQKIIAAIEAAKVQKGDLVIFSELAICGYSPLDWLNNKSFILQCLQAIELIKQASKGIAVLIGAPSLNPVLEGKDLYNSAYFIVDGAIKDVIHKSLLPTYDIFDEYRYFEPAQAWHCVDYQGKKLAITICEDIWDLVDDSLYQKPPMDYLIEEKPDLMINLSASPFSITHAADRLKAVRKNVNRYGLPLFYCNTVGGQNEIIFDGGSFVLDKKGDMVYQLPDFEEALIALEWLDDGSFKTHKPKLEKASVNYPDDQNNRSYNPDIHIDKVYQAVIFGLRDYFSKQGFKKAVVSSSGGIDSAVTLALAVEALGAEQVHALMFPSAYSSPSSVTDAQKLSERLGTTYDLVPIQSLFEQFRKSLAPVFKEEVPSFDTTEENIQARIRGVLSMAYSNKKGALLLNSSNKSELAIGYGTLYGDMAGSLSLIGDLYKTQVYALAHYINRASEIIPRQILTKAPSAELKPDQKDSDSLPDYDLLDRLLFHYLELQEDVPALINLGFDKDLVHRILALIHKNEFKRVQFCPILRISNKAFGVGRRYPLVNGFSG